MKKLFIILFLTSTFSLMSQWESCNNGISGGDIYCLINDGSFIYAGTNGGGIYKSSDNGKNWKRANTGLKNMIVNALYLYNKDRKSVV